MIYVVIKYKNLEVKHCVQVHSHIHKIGGKLFPFSIKQFYRL